jgi:tRNA-Thr(GGU) m(6)t(6)A37 methyltransferase TsaA
MTDHSMELVSVPVGIAYTPYETLSDAPHQGFADDAEAEIQIFDEYTDALSGIENTIRITVVYWAHLADRTEIVGEDGVGAFARRSPNRPNPLSICACTLLEIDSTILRVRGLDAVNESKVLDIKPALQTER